MTEIIDLINEGELDLALELLNAEHQEYLDSMPMYDKIFYHYIDSTHDEWIEARILRYKMKYGIDITKRAWAWIK